MATNQVPQQTGDFTLDVVEDTPITFSAALLLADFNDPDGDSLTLTLPTLSGLVNNGDGSWTYTPPANFSGAFFTADTATISDGRGGNLNLQLGVSVSSVNDLPYQQQLWDGRAAVHVQGREFAMAALPQADGRILVGGSYSEGSGQTGFLLTRLGAEGSRDTGFAGTGAGTQLAGSASASGVRVAQAADGQVVMAAQLHNGGTNLRDWGVVRFNADGTPDALFNGGSGRLVLDIANNDTLRALALGAGGEIVLGGFSRPTAATSDMATIVKLTPAGTLDPGFGGGSGHVEIDLAPNASERIEAVVVQGDGRIVAVGRATISGVTKFAVMRLHANGTLDDSFGSGGTLFITDPTSNTASGRAVHLLPDGSFYVGGYALVGSHDEFVLMRVSSSGVLDTAFGSNGFARAAFAGRAALAYDIAVQADGKVLLSGDASASGSTQFAAARFTAAGVLDSRYGSSGTQLVQMGSSFGAGVGAALDEQGRLLLVGQTIDTSGASDLGLARLTRGGFLDPTFNPRPPAVQSILPDTTFTLTEGELLRGWTGADEGERLAIPSLGVQGGGAERIVGGWRITPQAGRLGSLTITYAIEDAAGAQVNTTREFLLAGPTEGHDTLVGADGGDTIDGLDGNDDLFGGPGDDVLDGGQGNDDLYGGPGADVLDGGPGNDALYGAGGGSGVPLFGDTADSLRGGEGNDLLRGNAGADTLIGGAGDDNLRGDAGSDFLAGGEGNDFGSWRFDEEAAWPGGVAHAVAIDLSAIVPGATTTLSDGLGGTDTIESIETFGLTGSPFDDTLIGSIGNDQLSGWRGHDIVTGGAGHDTLDGGEGDDTLDGGEGYDFASYQGAQSAISVRMSLGNGIAAGTAEGSDLLISIEQVYGSTFDDSMVGSDRELGALGNEGFTGGWGNDTLRGLGSSDFLAGDEGDDSLDGGDGNDSLDGSDGSDHIDGGDGVDMLEHRRTGHLDGAVVDLQAGTAVHAGGNDTLIGIEHVDGSFSFADGIAGNGDANRLRGWGGNDSLDGRAGNDTLDGGDGDDSLAPGSGNDSADGGAGNDTLQLGEARAAVTVEAAGAELRLAHAGGTVVLRAVETVRFSDQSVAVATLLASLAQSITGTAANDNLAGSIGNDTITGLAGNDTLDGGAGDDSLIAGDGDDWLTASSGNDTLDGGTAGYDRANYQGFGDAIRVDLDAGTVLKGSSDALGNDRISNVERVIGTSFDDEIRGSGAADDFTGGPGNDTLDGREGNDVLWYGRASGPISLDLAAGFANGGEGSDLLISIENVAGSPHADELRGSAAANYFRGDSGDLAGAGSGADTIDGRGSHDTVDYRDDSGAVDVDLAAGTGRDGRGFNDVLISIEHVFGSAFGDRLRGANQADGEPESLAGRSGDDTIEGRAGNDFLSGMDGNDSLLGGVGDDTLWAGSGIDTLDGGDGSDLLETPGARAEYVVLRLSATELRLVRTSPAEDILLRHVETVRFSNETVTIAVLNNPFIGGPGADVVTGTGEANRLDGGGGNDTVNAGSGDDFVIGGEGSDVIDGGEGFDIGSWTRSTQAVRIDLQAGTATAGSDNDTLSGIEAIFGSALGDTLRGRDGPANDRGETLRGGAGNDSIDGGTGVDAVEYLGNRRDYSVSKTGDGRFTVRDNNLSDGDDGEDLLSNIERIVFADEMLAFGPRAEELARVAAVLWTPGILGNAGLFSRGFSFYDNGAVPGYTFAQMCQAALNFWTGLSDAQLAQRLKEASGTSKTEAQLLATMAAAGGGVPGRAAAVAEAAQDPGTTQAIVDSGLRETGFVAVNFVPGFGMLFGPWPELGG